MCGTPEFHGSAGKLVEKVRQECLRFQERPVLNDELCQIATRSKSANPRLKLVIDVKTRWSSTHRMLKNFLKHESNLRAFYNDEKRKRNEEFPLSDDEIGVVRDIERAFSHVDECVKRLSLADLSMRKADRALQVSRSHVTHSSNSSD